MKTKTTQTLRKVSRNLAALLALVSAPAAFAASQTWTNAPVNGNWNNTNNWVARAIPGALNSTGNGNNNDTATFNSPLVGGIGGAGNPIVPDDATTLGARARSIGTVLFDTANVGAYVFQSPSAPVLAATGVAETGYLNVGHNNAIRMNDTVTNSQLFLVPLKVLLPSSTAGIFNLVNNSTNPSATLTISSIMHAGATTRATTFILDGVNTGENVVTNLSEGGGNATGGFTKRGAGTWILRGTGTFPGASPLNINEGTLVIQVPDAFGAATTAVITNTGKLVLDGITLNQANLNLRNGGTILAKGDISLNVNINGVAVGNQAGTVATIGTVNPTDVAFVGSFLTVNSIVSGGAADTVLNTTGPGMLVFNQVNTYIGKWNFGGKTNQIGNPSALGTGANANVAAGAVLDLTPLGAAPFVPTTAGFGGSGTGTAVGSSAAAVVADPAASLDLTGKAVNLSYNPASASGDLTRPALYIAQGGLTLSGNTFFINNTSGSPLGVGTYRLIQSAAAITSGGGYAALVGGSGLAPGASASIVVAGGNVDLVVEIYIPKNLVWSGTGGNWDLASSSDWLDGVTATTFHNSDNVTFNATGAANPNVNIVGTLAPASITVDTSANDYSFSGAGQIAGTTSLIKNSAGVLSLGTANTYAGGTVVSNGTLRVAVNNAISSTGAGDVAVYGSGVIDMNGFNNTINGLNGNGAVDSQTAANSVLTVGNNDHSGSFNGQIKNTSGTLAVAKIGTGTQTISGANSYTGTTTVNGGTLNLANPSALGVGDLTLNSGTINLQTGLNLNSLAGAGGVIANNSTTTTNAIRVTGTTATTFGGSVTDGSGGGGVSLTVLGGSLTMSGISTYTGGTFVGSGAQFAIPNGPAAVGGFVIASNNSTLYLSGGSGTPGTPNSVTTVPGAKVFFASGAEGKIWQAQFHGSVNSTNRFISPVSAGQSLSFADFPGVVEIANTNDANQNFRFFNGGGASGGDNTLFVLERGNIHTRDAQTVKLGALVGGSSIAGIGGASTAGAVDTYEIGALNQSAAFHGYISGSNNLVKAGSGTLTLDGIGTSTNTVTLPDPFEPTNIVQYLLSSSLISYQGATTVSNGVLKIVAPNNLTNSPSITLAGGTLDASQIGYLTTQTTVDFNSVEQVTNTVIVTSGVLQIIDGQSLNGTGSIVGSVTTVPNSTVNVGQGIGTLAVSGSISLNGTVNMDLNRSNPGQNSDRLTAASFSGSGATLNITNTGGTLLSGTVFQLFNHPVTAFTTVNLPATSADGAITYTWQNNIAVDGSVTLVTGLSATPTPLTSVVNGSNLTLSWPADHTGWTLQAQTNALSVGITGTWFDVGGSAATNQVTVPVSAANPTVFYRLVLPLP